MSGIISVNDIGVARIQLGDNIIEGGDRDEKHGLVAGRYRVIRVDHIDLKGCDQTHIHFNKTLCYHHSPVVSVAI